ncbi:MAG: dihydropteroate synthase [Saccharofermentanales bacterium]
MENGKKIFEWGSRTYIMGILNMTPDSFSDGGRFADLGVARQHALAMVAQGADIIDVGGESTRPKATPVDPDEEIARVIPIISDLSGICETMISVDTYHAKTALAAIEAGATFVNDVWGLQADPDMADVIAAHDVYVCLMHNRKPPVYNDFIEDVKSDLSRSIELAIRSGIKEENIIIDPGIGFAKTYEQNIEVMKRLDEFKKFGYPLLLGVSRKSIIGMTLNLPLEERLEGTIAVNVMGIIKGADIIRVHDIEPNRRAAIMTDRMVR